LELGILIQCCLPALTSGPTSLNETALKTAQGPTTSSIVSLLFDTFPASHAIIHHVFRNYWHHRLLWRQAPQAEAQVLEYQYRHGAQHVLTSASTQVRSESARTILPLWSDMYRKQLRRKGFLPAWRGATWYRRCLSRHFSQSVHTNGVQVFC